MEQLQRLADVIAQTYVDSLRMESGSDLLTVNGITGRVDKTLLMAGLLDNAISAAKDTHGDNYERHAHAMLMRLINLQGREYLLTPHGVHTITYMLALSLGRQTPIIKH